MNVESIARRLRGAVRNAVAWGVAWFTLGFVTILALRAIGVVVPSRVTWLDALGMSIKIGVMGGITGGAFSAFISLFYRGRRLSEINWVRFGLGGGIVAGLFVPAFMVIANLISGDGLPPFEAIRGDIIMSALFGGVAAGASMWLAQRGEALPGGREDEIERLGAGDSLASAGAKDARQRERAPSGEIR